MNIARNVALGILLLPGTVGWSAPPQSPANNAQPHNPNSGGASTSARTTDSQEGEQKFRENCGRCHTEPQAISPRETKAVMQHMRVRASLSAHDAELIRHFLAP